MSKQTSFLTTLKYTGFLFSFVALGLAPMTALAAKDGKQRPALVVTEDPIPDDIKEKIYSKPVRVRDISTSEITGSAYYEPTSTDVTRRVADLRGQMRDLQEQIVKLSGNLTGVERQNEQDSAEYYASVASINTQLQSGTTPGNPRLVKRLNVAERNLDQLGQSVAALNQLNTEASEIASKSAYLLEQTRAAYGLTGAVEEDHVRLAELEDELNGTAVSIERVMNTLSDDLTRTVSYMSSERGNLRTLALAVNNGDLYGRSLMSHPFAMNQQAGFIPASAGAQVPPVMKTPLNGATNVVGIPPAPVPDQTQGAGRILAKIKFDRPDVNFQQPVYTAISEALRRNPNATFEIIAVNPSKGNAAEVAIETTRARRNAERVMRTLSDMGLSADRITVSTQANDQISASEVQIFMH